MYEIYGQVSRSHVKEPSIKLGLKSETILLHWQHALIVDVQQLNSK